MNIKKLMGYALGPMGSAAFSLISLPVISWYFSATDIGRIVLLQLAASLTVLLTGMGLDQAYIREYHAAKDKAALLKSLFLLPLVLLFTGMVLSVLWGWERLADQVFSLADTRLGCLLLVFPAAMLLTRLLSLVLRMQEHAWAFSFSQLLPKLGILLGVGIWIGLQWPADSLSLILIYTLAQILTVSVLLWQNRVALRQACQAHISREVLRHGIRYGWPLALGSLAYWLLSSLDRLMLKNQVGLEDLGIYSMAVSFSGVALIFQSIFSTIWAPMVFKWVQENTHLEEIGKIACHMSAAVAAIVCLVGMASPLAAWLLPPHYAAVPFVLLSSLLFPLFYTLTEASGIGLNIARKSKVIMAVHLVVLAMNFALLSAWIPLWGIRGAAAANAVSFWLYLVFKTEMSSRLWRPLPRWRLYRETGGCLIVCLAYTLLGSRSNYPVFALIWLTGLLILLYRYRHPLTTISTRLFGRLKT